MDKTALASKSVAVVGGGISGISAAYNLWKLSHGRIQTTIYESGSTLGGHSYTVRHHSISRPIDIGFQVYNDHTYPTFKQFLQELDVEECPSSMSFSVETDDGFSWGSKSFKSLLSSFWKQPYMMTMFAWDMSRFYSAAADYITRVEDSALEHFSLPVFAKKYNLSDRVMNGFLIPFVSSVWSVGVEHVDDFDAYSVLKFMSNHRLLSFSNLQWKTLKLTSRDYIDKFLTKCQPEVKLDTKVTSMTQDESGKWTVNNDVEKYDHVVLALHGDDASQITATPNSQDSLEVEGFLKELSLITYSENVAVVHTDETVMPTDRRIWSSWNFKQGVVTYWENSLQPIGYDHDVFTTLLHASQLDSFPIDPRKRLGPVVSFRHPKDITGNMKIGAALHQGVGGLYACGAYMGYGFHEDGYRSGLEVATKIVGEKYQTIIEYKESPHSLLSVMFSPFYYILDSGLKYRLARSVASGCIGVQVPRGAMIFYGERNTPSALVSIHSYSMILKCLLRGELGFTEAYMDGDFSTDNLPLLMFYLMAGRSSSRSDRGMAGVVSSCLTVLRKLSYMYLVRNSMYTAKQNIADHYDLGNDFFASFLDATMTYSSGIFVDASCSLEEAQLAKYDRLCVELAITKDDHVLEIGTGWGGFACYVVKKTGCKVTTITLSHEQAIYARELVEQQGLTQNISVQEMDYRHIPHKFPPRCFDVVVSIEMIEAVGPANYEEYFRVISDCSTPVARVGIQAITRFEDNYNKYQETPDFINQYIFPGGCCPSLGVISQTATRNGLIILSTLNIAKSYAITLGCWRRNFLKAAEQPGFPFDAVFRRTWDMYFAMCQAAFEHGSIQDHQIIFRKLDTNPQYLI